MESRHGRIYIRLNELLVQKKMSKNMLSHRAEMQRTQINHYCKNEIARLDVDVLARICAALDCEIGDLLVYLPQDDCAPKKDPKDDE